MATSPDTFRLQAKSYRRHLKDTWDIVSDAFLVFEQEDIWPAQCNRVRNSVLRLSDPLQNFVDLMVTDRLPDEVVAFRYSLIIPLDHVDSLMSELVLLISAFRTVCRTSSRDTMMRHREIWRKCHDLAQGIDDILNKIDIVLIQAFSSQGTTVEDKNRDTTFDPQPVA